MSKKPAIIRKKEARQTSNPQRIALLVALFAAFSAVGIGGTFLFRSTPAPAPTEVVTVTIPEDTVDVVVAKNDMAYNERLKRTDLKVISWPKSAVPERAYSSIDDLFSEKGERYFMARTVANEVILPGKLSSPGRRATLAAFLKKNTRAVAVRVDDVLGVAGFVRPGDFVDVIMTRNENEGEQTVQFSSALLQNIHVLGVDQTSHVTSDVSDVVKKTAKTVTLEVNLVDAQKLALGGAVGRLSLALRKPRGTVYRATKPVRLVDLGHTAIEKTRGSLQLASSVTPKVPTKPHTRTIGVTRAVERTEMEVTPDSRDQAPTRKASGDAR